MDLDANGGWSRAGLRIYSDTLRLEEVEAALGLKATGAHLKGQLRSHRLKVPWHETMWRFGTSLKEDSGLEGNLVWLLDSLEPKRGVIQMFAEEHRVDFFCGFSPGDEQGGFTLSSDTLSRISKFGVPLIMNLSPPLLSDEGVAGNFLTEPGLEDRKWSAAALRVIGAELRQKDIELALDRGATHFHSSQLWLVPGGEPYWGTLWSLYSSLGDERGVTEHLRSLLDLLGPKLDVVRTLSEKYRVDLFCGFSSLSGQGGFTLDGAFLQRIAGLGVPLGVELYLPGPVAAEDTAAKME
jgi:hypothetical protein